MFSGTVFQLAPPQSEHHWTYNLLYTFTGQGFDGRGPRGALIFDEKGSLYGATEEGGNASLGTVFRLDPPAGGQTAMDRRIWRRDGIQTDAAPNRTLEKNHLMEIWRDWRRHPWSPLLLKDDVLYGTTFGGGTYMEGVVY